jgi:uncharacterized protein
MAFRKLAAILAKDGFHVLRFDYYGTGDSAGGPRDGSLAEWRQNIVEAAADLKECSGATKVSLVGLRLGATLAAQTTLHPSNLLLWDPVVSGSNYLDELRELHTRRFSSLLFPPRLPADNCGGELLGFPLPLDVEADIKAIDLVRQLACRAEHVVLVVSEERRDYVSLRTRLEAAPGGGPSIEYHHVPDESQSAAHEEMLLATQVLQAMAAALSRRAD